MLDDAENKIGSIPKIERLIDLAVAPDMNQALIVDGEHGDFFVVDLKTLTVLEKVHGGTRLSTVLYDPSTKEILLASGHSKDCIVVDATTRKVVKTVKLGGYAYAGITDEEGHAYFELGHDELVEPLVSGSGLHISRASPASPAALAELDEHSLAVESTWKEPCKPIRLLGIDGSRQRLIVGCGESVAAIDEHTGRIVATGSTGQSSAWFLRFDGELGAFAFVAHARSFELTVMVLHENSAGDFIDPKVIGQRSNGQLELDGKMGQIFVLSSDQKMTDTGFDLPSNTVGEVPLRVQTPVPGTFRVSVYAKN